MGAYKGKIEGGSGGKRGHSGMDHWDYTEIVKASTRRRRRLEANRIARATLHHFDEPTDATLDRPLRRAGEDFPD